MKMYYSVEARYVKGYGLLPFAKNMNIKHSQKLLDRAKKIYNRCNKIYFKKSN